MTSRPRNTLISLAILSLPALGYADTTTFSSYDECILESLKGVSSDVAANAIIASCRNTFPETPAVEAAAAEATPAATPAEAAVAVPAAAAATAPAPETAPPEPQVQADAAPAVAAVGESRELTKEELSKLKSTLLGFTTSYRITFENFNEDITITEVTIAVWDDLDPRGLKTYTETMHIPPSEIAKVNYKVIYMGDDQGWRWKIDSAKGIPVLN